MPSLTDLLHDRVDAREELLDRAQRIVESTIEQSLDAALAGAGDDMSQVLLILAAEVGDRLAGVTTDAVRAGREHAKQLARM